MSEATEYKGLIADIGATNARFALVTKSNDIIFPEILKCEDFKDLAEAASHYLDQKHARGKLRRASVAVAGPVLGDTFEMTNNPWLFSCAQTRIALGLESLHMFNDFEAVAMAIPHLSGDDYKIIGENVAPVSGAPIGIIGPGTGLGVSCIFHDGNKYRPVAAEGGHVTMPARSQREFDLFQWLLGDKYSHVSAERVCSGKGLVNVYNGLKAMDQRDDLPARTPEEISKAALNGQCDVCKEALDMMLVFLGRISGNLALTVGARGGIYIAGGIPMQLGDYFMTSGFRAEFSHKGRFRDYLSAIPTYLITNPFPAFIGLASDL